MSEPADWLRETADGIAISVKVTPRAGRDEIAGVQEGCLRVRLAAAPVEGAANAALVALLAHWLDVPRSRVALERGATGRRKVVAIRGRTRADVERRLTAASSTGR